MRSSPPTSCQLVILPRKMASELLACEAVDRIGGVHDHRERVVGDYDLGGFEPDFGEFHLFAELDLTGGHRDVRGVLRQCGDSHAAAASGHYDFGVGMFIEVDFGEFLRERQQGVAPLMRWAWQAACRQNVRRIENARVFPVIAPYLKF